MKGDKEAQASRPPRSTAHGHYERKHALTGLSADEIQRIIQGLELLRETDDMNGHQKEASISHELAKRVAEQLLFDEEKKSDPKWDEPG